MIYEHASTPAESVAAAKKLVENDKVFVLVIASGSTGAAAAADYVRGEREFRLTTPSARRRSFAIRSRATSFTAPSPMPSVSGQGMIDIAFRAVPNATKIGVLAGTYAFPQSHLAEIKPRLEKRGGVEVVVEQFDAAARDYTAQLISFARQRVQVVLILGSFTEAGLRHQAGAGEGSDQRHLRARRLRRQQRHHSDHRRGEHQELWGYFNAPYFPTQTDEPMAELSAHPRREKYGPPPQGRPNIYDLIGYGCTYVMAQVHQEGRPQPDLGIADQRLGDPQGCQAVRHGRL